jgi:hypothetical protein
LELCSPNFTLTDLLARHNGQVRRRIVAALICLLWTAHLPAAHRSPKTSAGADSEYAAALSTANWFLHAWQNQDQEAGLIVLTDAAKQHNTQEGLETFFAPGKGAAYEIGHGKKLKAGRYSFPVVLYQNKSGSSATRHSQVIVSKSGKDDWAVDKLP